MANRKPKYHRGQMLKNIYRWAKDHPAMPVENVAYDHLWNCYTYAFPLGLFRVEENMLEPTGEPDVDPDVWVNKYRNKVMGVSDDE